MLYTVEITDLEKDEEAYRLKIKNLESAINQAEEWTKIFKEMKKENMLVMVKSYENENKYGKIDGNEIHYCV